MNPCKELDLPGVYEIAGGMEDVPVFLNFQSSQKALSGRKNSQKGEVK